MEEKKSLNEETEIKEICDSEKEEQKIWDMKQELEDYLEEQGIYIRQQASRLSHIPPFAPSVLYFTSKTAGSERFI